MDKFVEYLEQKERFRKLTVKEQLEELNNKTLEDDTIIGEIYVQSPPGFENRHELKNLLGNAVLVDEYVIMGQGDSEVDLLFSISNLLIGVKYFAYWNNQLSMIRECKVYRFSKDKLINSLDLKEINKLLF